MTWVLSEPDEYTPGLDCIRSKWICSKCTKLHLGNETRRHLRTVQNEKKENETTREHGTGSRLIIRCIFNWMFLQWSERSTENNYGVERQKRKAFEKIDRSNFIDDGPAKRASFVFQFRQYEQTFSQGYYNYLF